MEEVAELKSQKDDGVQEEMLRDIEQWVNDCMMYNENYVDHQELLEKLHLSFDDHEHSLTDSFHIRESQMDDISKVLRKLKKKAADFEPTRQQLKQTAFQIDKKLNQFRSILAASRQHPKGRPSNAPAHQLSTSSQRSSSPTKKRPQERNRAQGQLEKSMRSVQSMPPKPKRQESMLEASGAQQLSGAVQDMDLAVINQDLQLRLDICLDEKTDLEKQLKAQAIRARKADEYQLKSQNLSDLVKQLKSRHALLVEKVKKHAEQTCPKG